MIEAFIYTVLVFLIYLYFLINIIWLVDIDSLL